MSVSTIVSSITKGDNKFYSVSTPNCSGTFIFDLGSSFTDKMKRELMGILVKMYTPNEIPYRDRNVLWSSNEEGNAIIVNSIPDSIKIQIVPIIDERYTKTFPEETLDTTFPIKIKFDDAPIGGSGSGGGGGDDPGGDITVLDGDIKDNPTSNSVVTSSQVYNFVMDNDVLVYKDSSGMSGFGSSGPLGSSNINILDGDIKDNPESGDVVTSQQTYDFVSDNNDLIYLSNE